MNLTPDIVIAGAGLTGLSLAVALKDTDYTICVLDRAAPARSDINISPSRQGASLTSGVPPRVSAVNLQSMALLTRIAGQRPPAASPYTHMSVWDEQGSASITFAAADVGTTALGYIVPNSGITNVLLEVLEQAENISLCEGVICGLGQPANPSAADALQKADAGRVEVDLEDGSTISAELVVGADGGNSVIRRQAGLLPLARDDQQEALVTTVQIDRSMRQTAFQCFTAAGPLALLPVSEAHPDLASVVWSAEGGHIQHLLTLSDEKFCAAMSHCTADEAGVVLACDRRVTFPLRRQFTPRFVTRGIALAGDAAHTIHPLGGQGVNLGFADVAKLAELLTGASLSDQSISDPALLREYAFARGPYNVAVAAAMEGFSLLYGNTHPALVFLRNRGMRLTNSLPMMKAGIARMASGLI